MKILLTHTPHMRDNYYGPRALAGLSVLGEVVLHQGRDTLEGAALIAAAGVARLTVAENEVVFDIPTLLDATLELCEAVGHG